jgi:hypothetical protein
VSSPAAPQGDLPEAVREQFDIQRNWLLNVLPPSREIYPVCRGPRVPSFDLCSRCSENRRKSGGVVADAVVPISYAPDDGQHYHQLMVYKSPAAPNRRAFFRLAVLYTLFYDSHKQCLAHVSRGSITHIATVPSTRERAGPHPLLRIVATAHPSLPRIQAEANSDHGNVREFHSDRFAITAPRSIAGARVLLLEELWVTGSRAQSMAHALKSAGAASVVIVALGRRMNRRFEPTVPVLSAAGRSQFNLAACALDHFV